MAKRAKAELEKRSWTVFPDKLQTATVAAKGAQAKPAP